MLLFYFQVERNPGPPSETSKVQTMDLWEGFIKAKGKRGKAKYVEGICKNSKERLNNIKEIS